MRNLELFLRFADGSINNFHHPHGLALLQSLFEWDLPPSTEALVLRAKTDDDRQVAISIPHDRSSPASARISD